MQFATIRFSQVFCFSVCENQIGNNYMRSAKSEPDLNNTSERRQTHIWLRSCEQEIYVVEPLKSLSKEKFQNGLLETCCAAQWRNENI